MQRHGAELVRVRNHIVCTSVGPVLQQAARAEAMPLRVHQEPEPPAVRHLSQRQAGRSHLRRSVPDVLVSGTGKLQLLMPREVEGENEHGTSY